MVFQIQRGVNVIVVAPLFAAAALIVMSSGQSKAVPVVPNFTQGSMTTRTETKQTINETINSMDYSTGYQYSVTGTNVKTNSGQINLPTTQTSNTIDGVTSSWTGLQGTNNWVQANPGAAFQFTETYQGPGLQNQTIIQRETLVESITEATSIFSQ
jgi:hypothetical protein